MKYSFSQTAFAGLACLGGVATAAPAPAATCTTTLTASIASPSVASGYTARLVANGLTSPRGIIFDAAGNLLVVQSGVGLAALTFDGQAGACVTVKSVKTVISDTSLNHGVTLNTDGSYVFVSNSNSVTQYQYTASTASTTSAGQVIITNMTNSDHVTRTLYFSNFAPNTLIVARGSGDNLDPVSGIESSGRAQVRAFDLSARGSSIYEYQNSGKVLSWGTRNDVGVDEHPKTGGIFTVENSADQITRNGVDVHDTNPAEELNYLGTLVNNVSPNQGSNFGYPFCLSVWNKTALPDNSQLKVGEQFAFGTLSATNSDAICKNNYTAPAAVFHPHLAPLDILFNPTGSRAYVTFHGSWDSTTAVGYKLSYVNFNANGMPSVATNSHNAENAIFSNANTPACGSSTCVRPVGLAFDSQGRLFFSSDATGEIWVITKNSGSF